MLAVIALAITPAAVGQTPPSIREFDLATVATLGRTIAEQDARAARATDLLLAQIDATKKAALRGWIVDPIPGGSRVRFLVERDGAIAPAYDIDFIDGTPPTVVAATDASLSADQAAQLKAIRLASKNIERPCSDRYNTVALREPGTARWLVWTLAATTDRNLILVGGHYRFTISADGETIEFRDALSASCLRLDKGSPELQKKDAVPYFTHIVSKTPVETHVFLSLFHRTALYVGTSRTDVWVIEGDRIRQVTLKQQ